MTSLAQNFELKKYYLCLDAILYTTIVFTTFVSFVWFSLWITGIQDLIIWLFKQDVYFWMQICYLFVFLLVILTIGYVFVNLLESMDQNLLVINNDRLFLLQQNMDLWNENKDIKRVLSKMMHNLSDDDKKIICNSNSNSSC
jgi:hypothetical protein